MESLAITSEAFYSGARIPDAFTCTGENISPPLSFGPFPAGTRSLVVICEDPDAPSGNFVHWILYNIPPATTGLARGVPRKLVLPDGSAHGLNDFGRMEYSGPCPPPGKPHRYYFRLSALDTLLHLRAPVTRKSIGAAMAGHTLNNGELMGTFSR